MASVFLRAVRTAAIVLLVISGYAMRSGFGQEAKAPAASVSFSLDFPQSIPDHYAIAVSSDGQASYDSTGKLTPDSEPGDPFHLDFSISPASVHRIFDLAAKAKYFDGKIDSGKRNLASTGAKVLSYNDATHKTRAEYNYSPIPAVQELTALLQNLSSTLEFGRRLDYYHHHQKLALEDELKRMEEMAHEKNLEEIQAVAPILQQIVDDKSVLNVSRARAQRLLGLGRSPVSSSRRKRLPQSLASGPRLHLGRFSRSTWASVPT